MHHTGLLLNIRNINITWESRFTSFVRAEREGSIWQNIRLQFFKVRKISLINRVSFRYFIEFFLNMYVWTDVVYGNELRIKLILKFSHPNYKPLRNKRCYVYVYNISQNYTAFVSNKIHGLNVVISKNKKRYSK